MKTSNSIICLSPMRRLLLRLSLAGVVVVAFPADLQAQDASAEGLGSQTVTGREIAGETYRLRLLFEDSFASLNHWVVESTGLATLHNNQLQWDCRPRGAGTIWCRHRFEGPTIVEYDVDDVTGARNLNFILYASDPANGLLETTQSRTGAYKEYHTFPNYIVTYLSDNESGDRTNFSDSKWRIRFRRNSGFNLLSEAFVESSLPPDRKQHIVHVFDAKGTMRLVVDGKLLHEFTEKETPIRTGYHGFRTWKTAAKYSNFRVHSIVGEAK